MSTCGSPETRLVVLRGNSASGKTTVARLLQAQMPGQLAWVGQDVMRRDVLKIRDRDDNPAIGLIDTVVRHALDQGFHVVLEGILHSRIYQEMLRTLVADHLGLTRCFRYRISFDETVRRHATKPQAAEYGAELMSQWYRPDDPIAGLDEQVFDESVSLHQALEAIRGSVDWPILRPPPE
ncbi:AAA family ATPase [Aestuariimicrobium ganziense]|uniref:AAA family ATPase n=1 Tax=Aestuariimicrobium ganziense TaxID=2773677 RepID=UPI0019452AC5|nr:AAA family ATPase [Aestuariimicrobium ganziense]